jgi:hypothetical protein
LRGIRLKGSGFFSSFFAVKGFNAKDIDKEMFAVYGGKFLLRKAVYKWLQKFSPGRLNVAYDAQPGHPVEIATEATVLQVEELMEGDRLCSNCTRVFPWFNIQHDA